MSAPRVSVLLPFRDVADTLEEALRGVLSEDVPLEVIAVDDGSRDDGPARVQALGDARVRLLHTGGVGLVGALNQGLSTARAPLVARMDGDDVSLPGRLRAQCERLDADASLTALGTEVEAFPEGVLGEGLVRYVAWQNALHTPDEHALSIFVEAPLCHPSVMFRAEQVRALGGYRDVPWPEDYDLWLRLDSAGMRLAKLDAVYLRWRHREGRATFTDPRYAPERFYDARAPFLAARIAARGRPLTVWGAGPTGRKQMRALEAHGARVTQWVDIDPRKVGRIARGARIVSPEALVRGESFVVVCVGARGARDLVRAWLLERGFVEGEDFVCAS